MVLGAPSVEIQRLPAESKATLSGHDMGETSSLGNPAKYELAKTAGSPHRSRMFHPNSVPAWPPISVISMTCPYRFPVIGFASSTFAAERAVLLVRAR